MYKNDMQRAKVNNSFFVVFKGSYVVKLPHQAVLDLTLGFMNKLRLICCICHCTLAFTFSPQATFRALSFMRLTGRALGKR